MHAPRCRGRWPHWRLGCAGWPGARCTHSGSCMPAHVSTAGGGVWGGARHARALTERRVISWGRRRHLDRSQPAASRQPLPAHATAPGHSRVAGLGAGAAGLLSAALTGTSNHLLRTASISRPPTPCAAAAAAAAAHPAGREGGRTPRDIAARHTVRAATGTTHPPHARPETRSPQQICSALTHNGELLPHYTACAADHGGAGRPWWRQTSAQQCRRPPRPRG
jgi:hypothetical protein